MKKLIFHTLTVHLFLPLREFMRRVTASKLKETNPKCEVACEVKGDYSVPTIDVTFGTLLWCLLV